MGCAPESSRQQVSAARATRTAKPKHVLAVRTIMHTACVVVSHIDAIAIVGSSSPKGLTFLLGAKHTDVLPSTDYSNNAVITAVAIFWQNFLLW